MRVPAPLKRLFDWLEPPTSRLPFEEPPGVGRIDLRVALAFVPIAAFAALVFAAPLSLPPGSAPDLSGAVGYTDNEEVWSSFPQPARFLYQVGDIACHQKLSRSFVLNGNEMPFCARDVAIFAGAALGLALCLDARSRLYRRVVLLPWWSYLALLVPIAIDGGLQDFLGFESDNVRRVVTGLLAGLAVAFALAFIAYESHFAGKKARRGTRPSPQPGAASSEGTGSLGSKAVESAPTEKNRMLTP
jgi:uncharacterized membrane protein